MARVRGKSLSASQGYLCAYCDAPGAPAVAVGLHACWDLGACSDRMHAAGLGRRDWSVDERESVRASLVGVLLRRGSE